MTERYAFRYSEFLIGQLEQDWLFPADGKNPLWTDIQTRFAGRRPEKGTSRWGYLGVRAAGEWEQALAIQPLTADYGTDACRIALLENEKVGHKELTAAWREVGQLWHFLKDKGNIADLNQPLFYPFLKAVQAKDFKRAWIELKTLSRTPNSCNLNCLFYPFIPHLVRSLDADIHQKMDAFWQSVQKMTIPTAYFVQINGRLIFDFYPQFPKEPDKIQKEALSFEAIQNKIRNKSIQKIVFIEEKGINVVI